MQVNLEYVFYKGTGDIHKERMLKTLFLDFPRHFLYPSLPKKREYLGAYFVEVHYREIKNLQWFSIHPIVCKRFRTKLLAAFFCCGTIKSKERKNVNINSATIRES